MAVLLDTDHLTILQREQSPEFDALIVRLNQLASDAICTSIVSFHQQVQGWLSHLNQARTPDQVVHAYGKLEAMWRSFGKMNVVSFTVEAQDCFASLRKQRLRLATMDLRIASIALVTDSTLLSRNLRDFRQVPGLVVEDWTT